jgi:hypothetical protein
MKRCPQCEFIYEDDQSLCDMDGTLLVMDGRTFPNLQALATVPAKGQPQTKRVRAVPAFATIILAGVLGMVYYVSTQRNTDADSLIPPQPIAASIVNPVPTLMRIPELADVVEEPKPAAAKPAAPAAPAPAAKQVTAKTVVAVPVAKTSKEPPQKEESKVNSILKKTGRILKKPFKF